MTLLRLFGVAILAAVFVLLLRESGGKWAALAAVAGGVLLLFGLLERYREIFSFLTALPGGELFSETLTLCLRVVGLALITEVTAGMCRDLGEAGLSTKVEWCGRAEILVVCLPMLSRVLTLATGYLAE